MKIIIERHIDPADIKRGMTIKAVSENDGMTHTVVGPVYAIRPREILLGLTGQTSALIEGCTYREIIELEPKVNMIVIVDNGGPQAMTYIGDGQWSTGAGTRWTTDEVARQFVRVLWDGES